jgi:hypothetical protein
MSRSIGGDYDISSFHDFSSEVAMAATDDWLECGFEPCLTGVVDVFADHRGLC